MLLASAVQTGVLLPYLFRLELDLGAQGFDVFLTLPGVGVQFVEVLAELRAGLGQSFAGGLGAQFQLGKLLAQSLGMPARSFKLCTASRYCFCCLYLGGLPLLAIFREGLTGGAKLAAGFLEPLDLAAQSFLAC